MNPRPYALLTIAAVALVSTSGCARSSSAPVAGEEGAFPALQRPVNSLTTWVVPSMTRVGERDAPGEEWQARIYAARGETEAFQVVVSAPGGGLTNVNVEASDLAGPGGSTIPSAKVALYRERYVDVIRGSPVAAGQSNVPLGPGRYPDGLVPFRTPAGAANPSAAPFAVAAGADQPIWIDVSVPRGMPPGIYAGAVTVTADQGSATVPVSVKVWSFELPLRPSLRSSFTLWSHAYDPAYQRILAEHRVAPFVLRAGDAPALASDFGVSLAGVPYWSGLSGCSMNPAPSVDTVAGLVSAYPPDVDVFFYVADEITTSACVFPTVKSWARSIHQTRAKSLVTMAPNADLLDDGTGRSAVDIWAMLPMFYDPSASAFQQARQKGDELWSYTCLAQDGYSPKWLIDYAPMNYRIMPGFLNQSLGLGGILYWAVDIWTADPWNDVDQRGSDGSSFPGEGQLIYPGEPVGVSGPVPSMRLKWIRDAVDDYEYVELLKAQGRGDLALEVARGVGADWRNWSRDPAVLEQARIRLGTELDGLGGAPALAAERSARPGSTGRAARSRGG